MLLSKEEEFKLVREACDKENPERESTKNRLFEYIYNAYREFLLRIARAKGLSDSEDVVSDFITHLMDIRAIFSEDEYKDYLKKFNLKEDTFKSIKRKEEDNIYIPLDKMSDEQRKLLSEEAMHTLMNYANYRICIWNGKKNLKNYLVLCFKNYIIDESRKTTDIKFEKDSEGKVIKDEYGSPVIKSITIRRPSLSSSEVLFKHSEENGEETLEENPFIHEAICNEEEKKIINKLMQSKIKEIYRKALRELSKINPKDAKIIFMYSEGKSVSEIAKVLGITNNAVIKRMTRPGGAFDKYKIIFMRLLKEEGIAPEEIDPEDITFD